MGRPSALEKATARTCRHNNRRVVLAAQIAAGIATGLMASGGKPSADKIAELAVAVLESLESRLCRFEVPK